MSFARTTLQRTLTPLRTLPQARLFSTSPSRTDLARMTLIGRLGGVPEATQTSTGSTMYKYAIATGYGPREARETSWFNIVAFQDPARPGRDLGALEKGSLVYVEAEGRMVNLPIPGEESGKTRKALNLVQRNLQVLQKPLGSQGTAEDSRYAAGNADGAYTEAGA